jgi:PKD repeat protein
VDDPFSAFTDASTIADGSQVAFTYNWDFGDAHASPGNPNTSSAQHPQHKYTAADLYEVSETVTSNAGCSNSVTQAVMINGSVPVPRFAFPAVSVCGGDTVRLRDLSTVSPGNVIRVEVYWY